MKYHIIRDVIVHEDRDAYLFYLCGKKDMVEKHHRWKAKYHQGVCKCCERIANAAN